MKVIKPGIKVTIGDNVDALVTSVMIEGDGTVSYKVAWWNGLARNHNWLSSDEVKAKATDKMPIGFKP